MADNFWSPVLLAPKVERIWWAMMRRQIILLCTADFCNEVSKRQESGRLIYVSAPKTNVYSRTLTFIIKPSYSSADQQCYRKSLSKATQRKLPKLKKNTLLSRTSIHLVYAVQLNSPLISRLFFFLICITIQCNHDEMQPWWAYAEKHWSIMQRSFDQ